MDIKLYSLSITNFDSNDIEKIRFVKEMKAANEKDHFLYNCIDELIKKSETTPQLHIGYGYIIKDQEKLIGYFRPARRENCYVLSVDYGVHPKFRHQGYGTKILVETSEFFLNNFDDIHAIKLLINCSNEYSIKCAQKANFIQSSFAYEPEFYSYLKRK